MKDREQIGRLAMRQEGGYWNAYYAMQESMEGAHLLGSIRMALIIGNKERKEAFMQLMQDCVAELIKEATGTRPNWGGPTSAPEHERAGSA